MSNSHFTWALSQLYMPFCPSVHKLVRFSLKQFLLFPNPKMSQSGPKVKMQKKKKIKKIKLFNLNNSTSKLFFNILGKVG